MTESADVIDVARAGGQYQVVIGPKVAQVYNAVVKQLPQGSGEDAPEEEERERPTTFRRLDEIRASARSSASSRDR